MKRKLIHQGNRGTIFTEVGREILAKQADATNYYNGTNGFPQDYDKAFELFKEGARIGDPTAAFNLGQCYWNGHGVAQDQREAIELWRMAGELGEEHAQTNYIYCLRNGIGCDQDIDEANRFEERYVR